MADPGIASAELHKVAPTALLMAGVAMVPEPEGYTPHPSAPSLDERRPDETEEASVAMTPPPRLGLPAVPPPVAPAPSPAPEGPLALRLVSRRTLWDGGTQVQAVPALASLHPDPALRVHPSVLAELGTAERESIRVRSARGTFSLPAVSDAAVPAGVAVLGWNLPGALASDLIDSSLSVTDITVQADDQGDAHG
jgi:anaerobic selenocysteine-containing dehydrogenase